MPAITDNNKIFSTDKSASIDTDTSKSVTGGNSNNNTPQNQPSSNNTTNTNQSNVQGDTLQITESEASRIISMVNLVEPTIKTNLSKFVYNRYERDEAVPREISVEDLSSYNSLDDLLNATENKRAGLKPPRFIKIVFDYNDYDQSASPNRNLIDKFLDASSTSFGKGDVKIQQDQILTEGSISNFYFSGIDLVDVDTDKHLFDSLQASQVFENIDLENNSPQSAAQEYENRLQHLTISNTLIDRFLTDLSKFSIKTASEKQLENNSVDELKVQSVGMSMNNLVIDDLVKASLDDQLHIFANEIRGLESGNSQTATSLTERLQSRTVLNSDPDNLQAADFEGVIGMGQLYDVEGVTTNLVSVQELAQPREAAVERVGTVVEKVEFFNNRVNRFPPQFLVRDRNNFFDTDIRYGASYIYLIRNLYAVEYDFVRYVPDLHIATQIIRGLFFVASKPSAFRADAIDTKAPRPPKNLKFKYLTSQRSLRIHWEFPLNKQLDIKGFQIFRRKSLFEPYTLIGEINFNDSFVLPERVELAPDRDYYFLKNEDGTFRIERTFYDDQFDESSEFMYAIASVDAHGLTSNYSQQVKVKLNRVFNRIDETIISKEGAPKPYPNIYLNKDFFQDTIKTSQKKRCTVYYTPEYAQLTKNKPSLEFDSQGEQLFDRENLNPIIFSIDDEPVYTINFLNTDLQKNQKLDIVVRDRSTTSANIPSAGLSENNLSFNLKDKDKFSI